MWLSVCVCSLSICMHSTSFRCGTWTPRSWQNSRPMWQSVLTRQITRCSRRHNLQWYMSVNCHLLSFCHIICLCYVCLFTLTWWLLMRCIFWLPVFCYDVCYYCRKTLTAIIMKLNWLWHWRRAIKVYQMAAPCSGCRIGVCGKSKIGSDSVSKTELSKNLTLFKRFPTEIACNLQFKLNWQK